MKLSAYHKEKGDRVEFYNPLWKSTYDKVYASKIFHTKKKKIELYLPENCIKGGSGFNLRLKLPEGIEHLKPDYPLYNLNYSVGFTTRGCIRNCEFCIVRGKEGYIKEHAQVEEFLNPESDIIVLLDNNFLALPSHIKKLLKFINKKWKIDFNQGLDIRLINNENAKLLKRIKHYTEIRFAWDIMDLEKDVKKGLRILFKNGIKPGNIMVYLLCGFNTNFKEDVYRFNELKNLGVRPFVMMYNNIKSNQELHHFARWVNRKYFTVCNFDKFNPNYKEEETKKEDDLLLPFGPRAIILKGGKQ